MIGVSSPQVTAVVPAYKAASFLGRTLQSLAAQTWENLEIIVGDDASPDSTAVVIRDFAAGRPNVKTVPRKDNLGWMGNTNDLMARASGDYVFFMPHDDALEPTYVERLATALQAQPDAVIAYSDLDFARLGEAPKVHSFSLLSGLDSPVARARVMAGMPPNWWVPHRGVFRREAFLALGGLRPAPFIGQFSADYTWLFQLALAGGFIRVPEVLYHKVWMPESLSLNWKAKGSRHALLLAAAAGTLRSRIGPADKARILGGMGSGLLRQEIGLLPVRLRRIGAAFR
jgi:glycosyltransferase involved in cell wall biosynthesis